MQTGLREGITKTVTREGLEKKSSKVNRS
jgi:hypothetical protein